MLGSGGSLLRGCLTSLAVYDIVAQVPVILNLLQRVAREDGAEQGVGFVGVGGGVEVLFRMAIGFVGFGSEVVEGSRGGFEVLVGEVLTSCGIGVGRHGC